MRHGWRAMILAAALGAFHAAPAASAALGMAAGSKTMSAEEKAMQPDAAAGAEHAVILVDDTERDENLGSKFQIARHLRAKVLSSEGRDIANVEIPAGSGVTLKSWWGFSIAPDGTVSELPQAELHEQSVMKTGRSQYSELKGVIPGVEPGSVIDYGYVLSGTGYYSDVDVELQREYAIRKLRYRWRPYDRMQGEYVLSGTDMKKVRVQRDGKTIVFEADDMRPVDREPYMPPDAEVRTTVTMFYGNGQDPSQFWMTVGGLMENVLLGYGPKDKSVQLAVSQMPYPEGADLSGKLRFVYDWVGRNIRNSGAMSAEEFELVGSLGGNKKLTARTILTDRYASPAEINLLYASFARALGAEAHLVFAVNRSRRYWIPAIKTPGQFSYVLVEVRMLGEPDDKAIVVDAASGLPYGELPWEASGTHGIVGVPNGFRPIALLPTMADRNVGETQVSLSFEAEGDALVSRWSYLGRGQQGREARTKLRAAGTEDRLKQLDQLCGAGGWEPRTAEAPGLEDRTVPFRLTCEIETDATNFDPSLGRYTVSLAGPWWPSLVEFPKPTRTQPIIFPYPRTDVVRADVAPPPGFRAGEAPSPVKIDTQIGSYSLQVVSSETGFHVERTLVLKALKVVPEGYGLVRSFLADVARADRTPLPFRPAGGTP